MTVSLKRSIIVLGISATTARSAFLPGAVPTERLLSSLTQPTLHSVEGNAGEYQGEASALEVPHFLADEGTTLLPPTEEGKSVTQKTTKKRQATVKRPAKGASHKEGVLSPVVSTAKVLMGDESLNKLRGKVISIHSDVIKNFVATSDTEIGQAVMARLYSLADKNGDGQLEREELAAALRLLGFSWLKDKQIDGILKRADTDNDGVVDFQEFAAEVPKTLKTNLVKLAKKNGGEMGLLS